MCIRHLTGSKRSFKIVLPLAQDDVVASHINLDEEKPTEEDLNLDMDKDIVDEIVNDSWIRLKELREQQKELEEERMKQREQEERERQRFEKEQETQRRDMLLREEHEQQHRRNKEVQRDIEDKLIKDKEKERQRQREKKTGLGKHAQGKAPQEETKRKEKEANAMQIHEVQAHKRRNDNGEAAASESIHGKKRKGSSEIQKEAEKYLEIEEMDYQESDIKSRRPTETEQKTLGKAKRKRRATEEEEQGNKDGKSTRQWQNKKNIDVIVLDDDEMETQEEINPYIFEISGNF